MSIQVDRRVEQMRALAETCQRRREDLVTGGA
jgi:hypothetical protein